MQRLWTFSDSLGMMCEMAAPTPYAEASQASLRGLFGPF